MNIYAMKGHKVKCETLEAGYDHHKRVAEKHLKVGNEYTVERTEVGGWHTDVYLQEFPDVAFNSVFFEDAIEQSEETDKEHPNYAEYND